MTTARCTRLGLPTGGDVITAWVNPTAWWSTRLAAAVAGHGRDLLRGRARRFQEPTR